MMNVFRKNMINAYKKQDIMFLTFKSFFIYMISSLEKVTQNNYFGEL